MTVIRIGDRFAKMLRRYLDWWTRKTAPYRGSQTLEIHSSYIA